MNFNPQLRTRLIAIVQDALPQIQVSNKIFIDYAAAGLFEPGDKALPANIAKELGEFVSDRPFSSFVMSDLGERLGAVAKFDNEAPRTALMANTGFESAAAVAAELVADFESLPWEYTFICPLPLRAAFLQGAPEATVGPLMVSSAFDSLSGEATSTYMLHAQARMGDFARAQRFERIAFGITYRLALPRRTSLRQGANPMVASLGAFNEVLPHYCSITIAKSSTRKLVIDPLSSTPTS